VDIDRIHIDSKRSPVNTCPMEADDNLPLRQQDPLTLLMRQDLDPLSIAELDERIAGLKSEITRCEAKISAASSHRSVADQLFKKA
jgi:uncharacterized small protein (DUF1192 family)